MFANMKLYFVCVIAFISAISASVLRYPVDDSNYPMPLRQLSHGSTMFNEVYGYPATINRAMLTAFAAGGMPTKRQGTETLNGKCNSCNNYGLADAEEVNQTPKAEEIPEEDIPVSVSIPVPVPHEQPDPETKTKTTKTPKAKPEIDDDDDTNDSNGWPYYKSGTNVFFPIMFGPSGFPGRLNQEEGIYPSGATAIANSFSTGKGGVATSHANAFGNPAAFRNSNWKLKSLMQEQKL